MVLCFPALIRIDSKLFLSETPIAFKIGEGLIVPDEQADPFEIEIPSLSRLINLMLDNDIAIFVNATSKP